MSKETCPSCSSENVEVRCREDFFQVGVCQDCYLIIEEMVHERQSETDEI